VSEQFDRQAKSFGRVAQAYDRGRPGYPAEAVSWLLGPEQVSVIELGAGTGKLTASLVAAGHDVHATEPDAEMLAVLRLAMPDVRTHENAAEEIPAPDRSVDVVVVGQAFHWFDLDTALPEIVRVLKPGGTLALVWNQSDQRIPWVKKMTRIIGHQEHDYDPAPHLAASGLFEEPETETFGHWQSVDQHSLVDLVCSRSNVATMDDAERQRVIDEALALYEDYGRGMDGMQWPYLARCLRVRALPQPEKQPEPVAEEPEQNPEFEPTVPFDVNAEGAVESGNPMEDSAATLPRILGDLSDDSGVLLIDFR